MAKGLVNSGGHHDTQEIAWVSEVTREGQTFDALADSGGERLRPLGLRLSQALTAVVRSAPSARALYSEMMVNEERAQAHGAILTGRQILHVLYESFQTNVHVALLHSITDLNVTAYPGDEHLHEFRDK